MRILHIFLFSVLLLPFSIFLKMKILPQASPKVTAYLLAVQWPLGVCTGDSGVKCEIDPMPTEFKIHGLWPQSNGPASNQTFDANKLTPIATELNKHWPNLKSRKQSFSLNLKFWEHEWIVHGKYSEKVEVEYFKKTLELFKDVGEGLKGKLAAQNIKPTLYNTYKLQAIEAALKKINGGFSCTVVCNQRKTSKKEKQIQEIRFSYTKDFKRQNNNAPSSTCGTATTDVMFPQ